MLPYTPDKKKGYSPPTKKRIQGNFFLDADTAATLGGISWVGMSPKVMQLCQQTQMTPLVPLVQEYSCFCFF